MTDRDRPFVEAPHCNCLLLCEDVLVSQARGRHILHGIVGTVNVPALPMNIGPFVAYIRLSNVAKGQTIHLRLDHEETQDTRFGCEATFGGDPDPLDVHTLMVRIPPIGVERDGRYILSVTHEGKMILYTPVVVKNHGKEDGDEPPNPSHE